MPCLSNRAYTPAVIDLQNVNLVDCHMHYMPPGFQQRQQIPPGRRQLGSPDSDARPGWSDLGELIGVMDGAGVDLGFLLTFPHHATPFRRDGEAIHQAIGRYNAAMSADVEAHGNGRFVMAASIDPTTGIDGVKQLERDLQLPHVKGIALLTNYGDLWPDDDTFTPIYELARDHNVPVTLHPGSPFPTWRNAARLHESAALGSGLGFFLVDVLAVFHMIHAGVFDRFPDVRFMFCQLGGGACNYCGRWEFHRLQAIEQAGLSKVEVPVWAKRSLSDVLSHVWMDTHTQDRHSIRLALEEAGEQSIVLGGDYPVSSVELGMQYMQTELSALELGNDVKRAIERGNALRLLGMA
jgi:predicted TIM-barrel fold metal-dependent hydrolase